MAMVILGKNFKTEGEPSSIGTNTSASAVDDVVLVAADAAPTAAVGPKWQRPTAVRLAASRSSRSRSNSDRSGKDGSKIGRGRRVLLETLGLLLAAPENGATITAVVTTAA